MEKEIIWNNETWIIDYGERVIYKKVRIETGMLPINASIRCPFREFKDVIYFQKGNNLYKIIDDNVSILDEKESKNIRSEIKDSIELNNGNEHSIKYISLIISSILIEDILKEKFDVLAPSTDLCVAGKVTFLVDQFKEKFPYIVKQRLKDISNNIIGALPKYIHKSIIKKEVKKSLDTMFEENTSYLDNMKNQIYNENKTAFENYANSIKKRYSKKNFVDSLKISDEEKERINQKLKEMANLDKEMREKGIDTQTRYIESFGANSPTKSQLEILAKNNQIITPEYNQEETSGKKSR